MKTTKEIIVNHLSPDYLIKEGAWILDGIISAMKEYAKLKCEEQKEICVGKMPAGISAYHPTTADEIVNRVKYAPLPNFD